MQQVSSARRRLSVLPALWRRASAKLGCAGPANPGRAGAVAIVTAVAAPALVMIVGVAVDYGYASYVNQRLARATNSATLGSISQTAATAAGGYTATSAMQTVGVNLFNANLTDLNTTGVNFSLSVVSDGSGGVIATGSYTYNSPTFFGGLLGINNISLSGTAKTTARPVTYVNYYILVDTSQSMGIAATQSDMDALYNRVVAYNNHSNSEPGCVFGCHVKANVQGTNGIQPYTNEDLAHNTLANYGPRINLRIDAAVSAIQSIINTASSIAGSTKNIQFALYTIQLDPATNLLVTPIKSMSPDYASLLSAAATIDLGNNDQGGEGDSDFPNELATFDTMLTNSGITANGSGASATSPLNFVFIISDGLYDVNGSNHITGAFNANNCTSLKNKATVGTIYTTYSTIWAYNKPGGIPNSDFAYLVQKYTTPTDYLKQGLSDCATSPSYAFQANDGPDIVAAMQSLFQRTQPSSARITQ